MKDRTQSNAVHDALVNGALSRAMNQEAKYGTGRTVPLAEHLATHTWVPRRPCANSRSTTQATRASCLP